MGPLGEYMFDEISRLKEILKEKDLAIEALERKLENYATIAELSMKQLLVKQQELDIITAKTVSVPFEGTVN